MIFARGEAVPQSFLGIVADRIGMANYELGSLLAVLLVTIICGLVGALVVGNRMAFFSDAMAHCAFAGVALGVVLTLIVGGRRGTEELGWVIPLVMVVFGTCVGVAIAWVREKTTLASDTVIGVFFAGAIGLGAVLMTGLEKRTTFSPEQFMFGSPFFVTDTDILYLVLLLGVTWFVLNRRYNQLILTSLSPSLARSRQLSVRFNNYLIIVLLAMIVNLSIRAVGVLLINAMLIVPAATAGNVARNLRQLFWFTLILSVGAGAIGLKLATSLELRVFADEEPLKLGPSGVIICLSVALFFVSMGVAAYRSRSRRTPDDSREIPPCIPAPVVGQ